MASVNKIGLGDEIQYKVGERRGRPTTGFVVNQKRNEITVLRPYRKELVKIAPEDVVALVDESTEVAHTAPARKATAKKTKKS